MIQVKWTCDYFRTTGQRISSHLLIPGITQVNTRRPGMEGTTRSSTAEKYKLQLSNAQNPKFANKSFKKILPSTNDNSCKLYIHQIFYLGVGAPNYALNYHNHFKI